jgi:hypothetical protein
MKYISSYKLFEAKNVGILYHFTSIDNLIEIIETNKMIGGDSISFTRDKNFINTTGAASIGEPAECRIVIDGDKLSNRYKIRPYNFFSNEYDVTRPNRETGLVINDKDFIAGSESEEVVLSSVIENIKDYIIRVDFIYGSKNKFFNAKPSKDELNVLRKNRIKFELIC